MAESVSTVRPCPKLIGHSAGYSGSMPQSAEYPRSRRGGVHDKGDVRARPLVEIVEVRQRLDLGSGFVTVSVSTRKVCPGAELHMNECTLMTDAASTGEALTSNVDRPLSDTATGGSAAEEVGDRGWRRRSARLHRQDGGVGGRGIATASAAEHAMRMAASRARAIHGPLIDSVVVQDHK